MSAVGAWTLTMKTPMGEQTGTLTVADAGEGLSATMTGPGGELQQASDVKAAGDRLTFKVAVKKPIPMTLHFDVTIAGDALSGKFRPGMFPPSVVTGARA